MAKTTHANSCIYIKAIFAFCGISFLLFVVFHFCFLWMNIKMADCLAPDLNCYADYKTYKEDPTNRAKTLDHLISGYLK